jgi:hypothetical protein
MSVLVARHDIALANPVGLDDLHPLRAGDDGRCYERPVLDHAWNRWKPRGHCLGVGDAAKRGIEQPVPAIRDEGMALLGAAQNTGSGHPAAAGAASTARRVAIRPNCTTLIGSRKRPVPAPTWYRP